MGMSAIAGIGIAASTEAAGAQMAMSIANAFNEVGKTAAKGVEKGASNSG